MTEDLSLVTVRVLGAYMARGWRLEVLSPNGGWSGTWTATLHAPPPSPIEVSADGRWYQEAVERLGMGMASKLGSDDYP